MRRLVIKRPDVIDVGVASRKVQYRRLEERPFVLNRRFEIHIGNAMFPQGCSRLAMFGKTVIVVAE